MIDTAHADQGVDMRQRAVSLAALGYRVFRLEPYGNRPVEKGFPKIATSDISTVREWWTDPFGNPTDHNIGIATGRGVIAIDYDCKGGKPGKHVRDQHLQEGMPQSARATTKSGGEHLFLKIPADTIIGSTVEKIAPGVDTRGTHGYVVGPGSVVLDDDGERREYKWTCEKPADQLDPCPEWLWTDLIRLSRYKDSPDHTVFRSEEDDTDTRKDAATRYLKDVAPHAIEGAGGDRTTYEVACALRDYGLSEQGALDLLLAHWNEQKASPPWDADELQRKVANAFEYARGGGRATAEDDFDVVEISSDASGLASAIESDPDWPRPSMLKPFDLDALPRREWVFKGFATIGTVSAIVAPSGAGKTQLLIQMAIALATGRSDICGLTPVRKSAAVWVWNQEDEVLEMQRRLAATMLRFGVTWADLAQKLLIDSGVGKPLKLAVRSRGGALVAPKHVETMIRRIRESGVRVLMIDPLVEFHDADENNNVEMAFVAAVLRSISVEAGCAVLIGHHDRKPDIASPTGHVGNQHSMRGASALQGVTRAVATLYQMSEKDAKDLGLPAEHRHRYVRWDGAKSNLSLSGEAPQWLRRTGQKLGLDGEEIGVLVPVDEETILGLEGGNGDGGRRAGSDGEAQEAWEEVDAAWQAARWPVGDGTWRRWRALADILQAGISERSLRTWQRWAEENAGRSRTVGGVTYSINRVKGAGEVRRIRADRAFDFMY